MAETVGQELKSFYDFLKYPEQNIFKEKLSVNNFLPLLSTYYVVFIAGIILLTPFAALAGLDSMPHKLAELQDMNKWLVLLIAVITQPFLEEVMFRLPLKYHRGLIVLILTMGGMIIYMALSGVYPVNGDDIPPMRIIIPIAFVTVSTIALFVLFNKEEDVNRIRNFVSKYFPHCFYLVAVYFAFVHFFNFETTGNQWLFTPIMVFPQFLMALFTGYSRLKYGFLSAVVLHMINNLLPLLVILFLKPA